MVDSRSQDSQTPFDGPVLSEVEGLRVSGMNFVKLGWGSALLGLSKDEPVEAWGGVLPRSARRASLLALVLPAVVCATALAQESPAQWIARSFDPASLGITQFPGAVLNRKQSVDAIVLERGGDKKIAVFLIPPDQPKAAADHFAKQFGVPPQVTVADSPYEAFTFDFTGEGKGPPKFAGLRVRISRAEFADNKGQITMEYSPPKPK